MEYTVNMQVSAVIELNIEAEGFDDAAKIANAMSWRDILDGGVVDGTSKAIGVSTDEWYLTEEE